MSRTLLILLLLLSCVPLASAVEYTGKVVGVSDGDTLTLLTADQRQIKVRLGEIDTPESGQPYGTRAKQALSDLVFNKQARVVEQGKDKYGRTVGRVYVGNVDVNAEMVRSGAAWVYRQYAKDASLYPLEAKAKAAWRGLWGLPEAEQMPPWEWRQAQRSGKWPNSTPAITAPPAAAATSPGPSSGFGCGAKKTCRQMTSCEEARFYLRQCGIKSLDGNHDGTPCEALCR